MWEKSVFGELRDALVQRVVREFRKVVFLILLIQVEPEFLAHLMAIDIVLLYLEWLRKAHLWLRLTLQNLACSGSG